MSSSKKVVSGAAGAGAFVVALVGLHALGLWAIAPAALLGGGVFFGVRLLGGSAKKEPEFSLEDFFRSCREHIGRMRVIAITIRSELRNPGFAADIEGICNKYSGVLEEFERDPLRDLGTGAVEVHLRELREGLEEYIRLQKQHNPQNAAQLAATEQNFQAIHGTVERQLQTLQASGRMDHQVRMRALLRVIVPETAKAKK